MQQAAPSRLRVDPLMRTDDYIVPEEEVLTLAESYKSTIIVDLDETLYLQNSTTDFIDCAAPGIFAVIVLKILDIFSPWRWTGGQRTRDIWRVRLILALFPWTLARWKRRCREHHGPLTNLPLLRALRKSDARFVIATDGFTIVVGPLLSAMGCADAELIACRLHHSADRVAGKLALIEERVGSATLAEAMVITDSTNDLDILRRCACPCLTQWKDARFQRPFRRVYLPGIYTARVKRPGGKGTGGIITTLSFWLLASMTAQEFEPTTVIVVIVLFLSLWSVYEIGYMDNDICAQKFETDPVFTDEARGFPYKAARRGAWILALILGGIGCLFVQHRSWPISFGLWISVLSGTRAMYYLFNRIDKKTRVWLHLMLQICREASVILIVPVGVVGVMACMAQIITRWQQYFIYRYSRAFDVSAWPELEFRSVRLLLFTVLCGLLFFSEQSVDLWAWPTAAIFAWCVFLARTEIVFIIKRASRIDVNGRDIRPLARASGRAPGLERSGDVEPVTAQSRRR